MEKNLPWLLLAVSLLFATHAASGVAVTMRWCCTEGAKSKCDDLMANLTSLAQNDFSMTLNASCVVAKDVLECMEKIQKKEADLVTLDGGDIVVAGKKHKMEVVVAEDYGAGPLTSYYGVAVVKKGSNFGIKDLKGKKSCHTGAKKTAGWNIPVGFLLSKGIMKREGDSCSSFVYAGKFFKESCVPGALLSKYDPKDENPDNLCALCKGTGDNKCARSDIEPYYGYGGAFKCMADGAGDVAFVKHTTTKEMTDKGSYGNMSDYQYLCDDGSRKEIGQHENCNLGKSPSHAVMTWADNGARANYSRLLVRASKADATSDIFNSAKYGGKDLVFKDSTKELVDAGEKELYTEFLSEQYLADVEALDKCPDPVSAASGSTPFGFFVLFLLAVFMAM